MFLFEFEVKKMIKQPKEIVKDTEMHLMRNEWFVYCHLNSVNVQKNKECKNFKR
jgi:hypothetical protein